EKNLKKIKEDIKLSMEFEEKEKQEHLNFIEAEITRVRKIEDKAKEERMHISSTLSSMVDIFGEFFIKVAKWTKAIISADNNTAKTVKEEIVKELKELETIPISTKLQE